MKSIARCMGPNEPVCTSQSSWSTTTQQRIAPLRGSLLYGFTIDVKTRVRLSGGCHGMQGSARRVKQTGGIA